jgi:Ribbon-helix-helix protein, copG family
MAITPRPKRGSTETAKPDPIEFIQGAERPEGTAAGGSAKRAKRARKEPVIIRFADETLRQIDAAAAKRGLSRAALVRLLVIEHLPD